MNKNMKPEFSEKQRKVLGLGAVLSKALNRVEDLEAELEGHIQELERVKTSFLPNARQELEVAQNAYEQAVKEAQS